MSYLTVKEAFEDLGIGQTSWYKLVAEDPTYPRPIKVGGSVRIDRAAHEAWKVEQQDVANWSAYRKALADSQNGSVRSAAARLGVLPADVELHRLALAEDDRLADVDAEREVAQSEMDEAHRFPRMNGLGVLFEDVVLRQDRASARLQEALGFTAERDALRGYFPRLFNLKPVAGFLFHVARHLLPSAIRDKMNEIDQAKSEVQAPPEETMSDADKLRLR